MISDEWCCMNCQWKEMCLEENPDLNLLEYCANYKMNNESNR